MRYVELVGGESCPAIGLGTAGLLEDNCEQAIQWALDIGYRLIDTAWAYRNQSAIGRALRKSSIPRSEIFISTKIWRDNLNYDGVIEQCGQILNQLQVDYIDLLLTHWPSDASIRARHEPNNITPLEETLGAFNEVYRQGKVRHLGVSNYDQDLLHQAQTLSKVPISVNQVHFHLPDSICTENVSTSLLDTCQKSNVALMAYCPLGSGWCPGKGSLLQSPILASIANQQGKTSAQIALKWAMNQGAIIIPKSGSEVHLRENIDIFDFELTIEQMQLLDSL